MIKQRETGQLIVISAPSGSGKGSIISSILAQKNQNLWLSVSTTTRPIRKNDIPGETYNFITNNEFEEKIKEGYFLEYAKYAGHYYGTPKNTVRDKLEEGIDVILEIEIEGAANIKKLIPEAVFIFIMPPSLKTLVKRLHARNTDSKEKIIERFHTAYKEINEVTKYNYVVVNDELKEAIKKVKAIIQAEKCRVDRIEEVFLDTKEEEIHELLLEEDKRFSNEGLGEKIDHIN